MSCQGFSLQHVDIRHWSNVTKTWSLTDICIQGYWRFKHCLITGCLRAWQGVFAWRHIKRNWIRKITWYQNNPGVWHTRYVLKVYLWRSVNNTDRIFRRKTLIFSASFGKIRMAKLFVSHDFEYRMTVMLRDCSQMTSFVQVTLVHGWGSQTCWLNAAITGHTWQVSLTSLASRPTHLWTAFCKKYATCSRTNHYI